MSIKKTAHFQNCLGVFQGGGCKAVAFVGAFEEAVKRGVFFSEVAGTSAGAIVAVLIGAGANPEQLFNIMKELDFKKFMGKPVPLKGTKSTLLTKSINCLNPKKDIRNYIRHLGFYSSNYISTWINTELGKLLNIKDRPVVFNDLLIPTTVVATDLNTQTVKLWDKISTSTQPVGIAVQTSCSIPFYFQPYERRFVDGGMVSNLPSFLMTPESIFNKVLAFGFKRTSSLPDVTNFMDLFKRVFFTAIDGGTDVQLKLQQNVSLIEIDTGEIEAVDFDKMTEDNKKKLINSGLEATKIFFEHESFNIRQKVKNENIGVDITETFNLLIKANLHSHKEILISDEKAIWIYSLFALLVKWQKQNTIVKIILKKNGEAQDHRQYKIRLLESFGFSVIEVDNIPFKGFIFDGDQLEGCAVVFNENEELKFDSKYYSCHEDLILIDRLRNEFNAVMPTKTNHQQTMLNVVEILEDKIIEKLKNVKQYNSKSVEITYEEINMDKVIFLTDFLKGYKYRLVEDLFSLYIDNGINVCKPAAFKFMNNKELIITPPVVEKNGEDYYVIEGNARIVYAAKNGYQKIGAMVVKNVTDSMPSIGKFNLQRIRVADIDKIGKDRYNQFNKENFRRIEEAVRNPRTSLV